ncbi:MAG: WYL domain-containing protein [Oscillospiraceae bacterium]|nr:WYL domain-containing protein [Oscillospiraceae bacterium]
MVFSELYSVYYRTVARILEKAFEPNATEEDLRKCVLENAFSESVLTILPSLKSGKWPLLQEDMTPVISHKPTVPLTTLEKRWLKAVSLDPRVQLFGVAFPDLGEVEPLFTQEDYRIYDQYEDGDPFESESYIRHFRLILEAIGKDRPVQVAMLNRHRDKVWVRFFPKGLEYSVKDDKIRVIADGCKFKQFNLGRIIFCDFYEGRGPWLQEPKEDPYKGLTLQITDRRNALERAMLHFAHFEKQKERIDGETYILRLKYYENDETEILIRVLSFGPCVKVLGPEAFVDLIKERLIMQKSCGLS